MEFLDDIEWGYDPAYVGEEQDNHDNEPVDPDDWARNNDDLDGGV